MKRLSIILVFTTLALSGLIHVSQKAYCQSKPTLSTHSLSEQKPSAIYAGSHSSHKSPRQNVKVNLYYLSFHAETYTSLTPAQLRNPARKRTLSQQADVQHLVSLINRPGKPGHFVEDITRLIIEPWQGNKRAIIDRDGTVKIGKREYQLNLNDLENLEEWLQKKFPDR